MDNINLATASAAELAAAGFTLTVKKSQAKSRRSRKSLWGVKPRMNAAQHAAPVKIADANESGRGTIG